MVLNLAVETPHRGHKMLYRTHKIFFSYFSQTFAFFLEKYSEITQMTQSNKTGWLMAHYNYNNRTLNIVFFVPPPTFPLVFTYFVKRPVMSHSFFCTVLFFFNSRFSNLSSQCFFNKEVLLSGDCKPCDSLCHLRHVFRWNEWMDE